MHINFDGRKSSDFNCNLQTVSATSEGFTKAPTFFDKYDDGFTAYTTQGSDILHIGHVSRRVPVELVTFFKGTFIFNGALGVQSPFHTSKYMILCEIVLVL